MTNRTSLFALNIVMAIVVLILLVTNFGLGLIALVGCALIALKLSRRA